MFPNSVQLADPGIAIDFFVCHQNARDYCSVDSVDYLLVRDLHFVYFVYRQLRDCCFDDLVYRRSFCAPSARHPPVDSSNRFDRPLCQMCAPKMSPWHVSKPSWTGCHYRSPSFPNQTAYWQFRQQTCKKLVLIQFDNEKNDCPTGKNEQIY